MITANTAEVHSTVDVDFIVETGGPDIVAVDCGEIVHYLDTGKGSHQRVALSYIRAPKGRIGLPRWDNIDYRHDVS